MTKKRGAEQKEPLQERQKEKANQKEQSKRPNAKATVMPSTNMEDAPEVQTANSYTTEPLPRKAKETAPETKTKTKEKAKERKENPNPKRIHGLPLAERHQKEAKAAEKVNRKTLKAE